MKTDRCLVAFLIAWTGCATQPQNTASTPPSSPRSPAAAPSAHDRVQPPIEASPSPSSEQSPILEDEPRNATAARINARYEQKTNARQWERNFEHEGREAFDHRDDILAALAIQPGQTVADIGAGSGLFTMAFAEVVGESGRVYAVDIQDYFLEHIEQRANKAGYTNITTLKAKPRTANLPSNSVDIIFLCDVFHHIEYPMTYLTSLRAALRPNGRLILIDYIADSDTTSDFMLNHIRATPTEFRAEIEAAGFVFETEHGGLEENFFFVFHLESSP